MDMEDFRQQPTAQQVIGSAIPDRKIYATYRDKKLLLSACKKGETKHV